MILARFSVNFGAISRFVFERRGKFDKSRHRT